MPLRYLLPALFALSWSCASSTTERAGLPPLTTVERLDLERYMGKWYEIASFPQRFQRGCRASTASYTLREDGDVEVINRCMKDGELDEARGKARIVERPAKLEVSFFWPFWGDYWVIDLGPDYEWAVVGHPGRDYLWILSRTPTMAPELYASILERVERQRYDTSRLVRTVQ